MPTSKSIIAGYLIHQLPTRKKKMICCIYFNNVKAIMIVVNNIWKSSCGYFFPFKIIILLLPDMIHLKAKAQKNAFFSDQRLKNTKISNKT